jgi:hypothetical protein
MGGMERARCWIPMLLLPYFFCPLAFSLNSSAIALISTRSLCISLQPCSRDRLHHLTFFALPSINSFKAIDLFIVSFFPSPPSPPMVNTYLRRAGTMGCTVWPEDAECLFHLFHMTRDEMKRQWVKIPILQVGNRYLRDPRRQALAFIGALC